MSLKEQMAADVNLFLDLSEFGEEVEWTPTGGEVLEKKIPLSFHQGGTIVNGQAITLDNEATIMVAVAAIPDPQKGASFVRDDGVTWKVNKSGCKGCDGIFWKLAAERNPLATFRM